MLFPLALALAGCSENTRQGEIGPSAEDDSVSNVADIPRPGRIGSSKAGADSSSSTFYIPDREIAATATSAKKGDNVALMRMINYYRFSYEGEDKDALSKKWEKIGADRANTVPLRSGEEIIDAMNKGAPADEIRKMEVGKNLRAVSANYFRILLEDRESCSVLKIYAEKAKMAIPDDAEEISEQLQGACNNRR